MSKNFRLAMLSPIAWRTPPRKYGPWERVVSLLTEGLVQRGIDVTLFATKESRTTGTLRAVAPMGYEEDVELNRKVWECLHISEVFEHAEDFDLIHNNFDFLPLSYSQLVATPVVTTIHGFSSPKILPVYQKYDQKVTYVSISNADREPSLHYIATVYHGIDVENFSFQPTPKDYLIYFGRIHQDKGTSEAIQIARQCKRKLLIAGPIQDEAYYQKEVAPHLDEKNIRYIGNVEPEQRNELLGNAVALLHPINFNEPFGLSVVEAMACGTPVVAFKRGSMPEVIEDGKTGFLVSTVAEASTAVDNLATIKRADCRQHVIDNFSVNRMVNDYLRVYQQILA